MERGQGKPLSAERIDKIRELLATSDLSIVRIAERIGCVRGRVSFINRKFRIRIYGKGRFSWTVRSGAWSRTAI